MTQPLIVRYTSDWPSAVVPSPAGEVVYGIPRRQDLMIALAQQQIAAQKAAARDIARSNLAGAQVIVNELNRQTDILAAGIEQLGDTLSSGISQASEQTVAAVDELGDRICASLDEIRWQLAQQGRTLDQILTVLLDSRNNEAQQLVRQGLRHYVNEQYEQAEERFRRALDYDSTDYQILLNLAFIEIHKGDAIRAFKFFRDALSLPDNLNDAATARALWATARLHYAEREYPQALDIANRALTLETTGDALFTTGVYAALAGDRGLCLKRFRAAVETDSGLFAKVAAAPNLGNMRTDVHRLLSEMASAALAEARRAVADDRQALSELTKGKHASSYQEILLAVRRKIDQTEKLLEAASYAGCLSVTSSLVEVREVIAQVAQLESLGRDVTRARDKAAENERRHQEVVEQCSMLAEEKAPLRWLGIPTLFYAGASVVLTATFGASEGLSDGQKGVLLTLLYLPLIAVCLYVVRREAARKRASDENQAKLTRIGESDTRLRESRAAIAALEQQARGLRERIARQLSVR